MKNILKIVSILCFTCIVYGCTGSDEQDFDKTVAAKKEVLPAKNHTPPPSSIEQSKMSENRWYKGTLTYFNLEGGFYGFIGDNGEKFLPLNLDNKYKQDGAIIKFYGHSVTDVMTMQMWGTPFQVKDVELIKAGSNTKNSDI